MAERYERIYSLPNNLYSKDSPVIVRAGALLRDNFQNCVLVQLKIENISNKQISIVKVEVYSLDYTGNTVDAPIPFTYSGLKIDFSENFGTQIPIPLRNVTTSAFNICIKEVLFADDEVWKNASYELSTIKEPDSIRSFINNQYALTAYTKKYGKSALYAPILQNDYWICTCGTLCMSSSQACNKCGASKDELSNIDQDALMLEGSFVTAIEMSFSNDLCTLRKALQLAEFCNAQDYPSSAKLVKKLQSSIDKILERQEAERLAEEERKRVKEEERVARELALEKKREKAKIRLKLFTKIASIVTLIAIVIGLIGYFGAYPLISNANGNYGVAIRIYSIEEFTIPDGTKIIKSETFKNCWSLTKVTLPDSIEIIEGQAFMNCAGITEITLPSTVKTVAINAFENCNIQRATLPADVIAAINPEKINSLTVNGGSVIPVASFKGSTSLTKLTLEDSVTTINFNAFISCSNLTTVTLGKGVKKIGSSAFAACSNIKDVYYAGSEEEWNKISIAQGNDYLKNATIYFNYQG